MILQSCICIKFVFILYHLSYSQLDRKCKQSILQAQNHNDSQHLYVSLLFGKVGFTVERQPEWRRVVYLILVQNEQYAAKDQANI